jgi:hypothetical protein
MDLEAPPNVTSDEEFQIWVEKLWFKVIDDSNDIYVTADSVTETVTDGTSGGVAGTQVLLDGTVYKIEENNSTPAIDVEFVFSGIKKISQIVVSAYYDGSTAHAVRINLWNYTDTQWDTFHTLMTGLDYEQHFITVPDDTKYISGGAAKAQLYHTEGGILTHYLYVDYMALKA